MLVAGISNSWIWQVLWPCLLTPLTFNSKEAGPSNSDKTTNPLSSFLWESHKALSTSERCLGATKGPQTGAEQCMGEHKFRGFANDLHVLPKESWSDEKWKTLKNARYINPSRVKWEMMSCCTFWIYSSTCFCRGEPMAISLKCCDDLGLEAWIRISSLAPQDLVCLKIQKPSIQSIPSLQHRPQIILLVWSSLWF